MAYLLDANVFIQAKNLHYGMDFCPAFWDWLIQANGTGRVFSIAMVRDEMLGHQDELAQWTQVAPQSFFLMPDPSVVPALNRVSAWAVNEPLYTPAARNTFLQVADHMLVATAVAHGHVVVTHEISSNSPNKIKIPNACIALGVEPITPYQMLRREHVRFVLGQYP